MVKVKRAKSKNPKFRKCQCIDRTKKGYCNTTQQCPHIHFKGDFVDRDQLGHNEYLNLLCTPKGYRWPPFMPHDAEEGEEDEENAGFAEKVGKRLICHGQKERKADRQYVHNFLAEVWALLTPEMINRLSGMLQNEFKMTPEEARTFIDKQMEYNIERSSSVSMYKKERKLDDGKVVWDSVVKLRKRNPGECSKYPKKRLGIRNSWIKEFSDVLSEKASAYVLETMTAERTNRQEEIAQTLLHKFNNLLEQEATMKEPQTLTHKAMVMMADRLSLFLDKNVKVSKSVGVRLRQIEEEEKKRKLLEEMARLEKERRDREEEEKRRMAEEAERAKKLEERSAREVMNPPPGTEPEEPPADVKPPEKDDKPPEPDDKPPEIDGEPPGADDKPDGGSPDAKQSDTNVVEPKTEGQTEVEQEPDASKQISEEGKANETENMADKLVEPPAEEEVNESASRPDLAEPEIPSDSPLQPDLGLGEQSTAGMGDTIESNYPAPDVSSAPSEAVDGAPSSGTSGISDGDYMNTESSKEQSSVATEDLLASSEDEKAPDLIDEDEIDLNLIGQKVDEKTNKVLHQLAEIIASTSEEDSPLQEAIKDMMEKELEGKLGDKDVATINEVAGKVGTWMDKMVERAAEEYGYRRSPQRSRSASTVSVTRPVDAVPFAPLYRMPEGVPPASFQPATQAPAPKPTAVPPDGLTEAKHRPPVSQKGKGPIFELRKVDTKNIFNVAGVSHTKAKKKIREARGLASSSMRVSQESLDIEEWAEWAGLVSDVSRNWAKWVEEVAQAVERPSDASDKMSLAHDVKTWKHISKGLQREGDVWSKKVAKKRSKHREDQPPETKPFSV